MYRLEYTTNFKKDLKTCKKRGLELHLLQRVIDILQETGTLPNQYRPHKLSGKFEGLWVDMALLKELAKKFGWNIGRKKSGIEEGLEDIKAGRVYKAKDMEDLKKYLLNQ